MNRMSRKYFYDRAKKHGHDPDKKKKITPQGRDNFKQELLDYFNSPEGQKDIAKSPHFGKPVEVIVEMLLQEVD